jgi:hypothetical protein
VERCRQIDFPQGGFRESDPFHFRARFLSC